MKSKYMSKRISSNNILREMLEKMSKDKKTTETQDNESLNTMDYYKEDSSSKNNILDEKQFIKKTIYMQPSNIISRAKNLNFDLPKEKSETFDNIKISNLYEEINISRNNPFLVNKNSKNVQKRLEDTKINIDVCIRCNQEIEYSTKVCKYCLKPICRNCLRKIFNRNLDNNDDLDNFDQNLINSKICPNCRNLTEINDYIIQKPIRKSDYSTRAYTEPSNTVTEKKKEKNEYFLRDLDKKINEYDSLLKEIEKKKKEIEIKKNLNMNIIQILQRAIEYEYNLNVNKLNEISSKIINFQNFFKDKKNSYKNYRNISELQNIFEKYKKAMNIFSKNYEKLKQKISLKSKPKSFKHYESNMLSINLSDTYYMKRKEILSNSQIGKAFFKVDRFVNGYMNCLNFSVLIQKDDKNPQNNNNNNGNSNSNSVNKSKFVAHLIINNKLIKLNKDNKDNNNQCLNYNCSLEESQVFKSKGQTSDINKNEKFDAKLIITELFL